MFFDDHISIPTLSKGSMNDNGPSLPKRTSSKLRSLFRVPCFTKRCGSRTAAPRRRDLSHNDVSCSCRFGALCHTVYLLYLYPGVRLMQAKVIYKQDWRSLVTNLAKLKDALDSSRIGRGSPTC